MSGAPAPPAAPPTFPLSGVVHLVRPLGPRVHDLRSLRAFVAEAPERSLFYHCVQYLMRHPTGDERPPDDFGAWAATVLQDREAAERLVFASQTRNAHASELRTALLSVLDELTSRSKHDAQVPDEAALVILAADSVPLQTELEPANGAEMLDDLAASDVEVWFFHLIEEPWFSEGRCPLIEWLKERGEGAIATRIEDFALSNRTLTAARERLLRRWRLSTLARRLADAGGVPDPSRREAGREAVTRLVRRVRRAGGSGS